MQKPVHLQSYAFIPSAARTRMANRASTRTRAPSERASVRALFHDPPRRPCPLGAHAQAPSSWGWGAKRARTERPEPAVPWRDWAGLTSGPAGLIAERALAGDVADYVSFRAVCRGWRACAADPRAHGVLDRRFHPRHWTMLRETLPARRRRRLLNVSTGRCIAVDLPELGVHDVFGPTTEGLLVLLDWDTYAVRLLNPITRQAADLPPATALLSRSEVRELRWRRDFREFWRISGAGLADDSTFAFHFFKIGKLAIIKPGQKHWTLLDIAGLMLKTTMSFAGRFYAATATNVMVVETGTAQPPRLAVAAELPRPLSLSSSDTVHLVDNDGELMLVDRERRDTYKVYRVDLDTRKMLPVGGLGGRAAFIGVERALSVSPSVFPSVSSDAVYLGFDDLSPGELDKSPYHLLDGTAEPRDFGYFGFNDLFTGELRSTIIGRSDYPWRFKNYSNDSIPRHGPWGVGDYLSSCVTLDFHDHSEEICASFTVPKKSDRRKKPNKRIVGLEWVK
ncbi:hypothetical protein ACP70R_005546 [Stipagrostis hirtigluma subsp. patula]